MEIKQTRNTFYGKWYLPHSQVHNDRTIPIKILAIRALNKGYIVYFSLCMHDTTIFLLGLLGLKYDITVVFLDSDFLQNAAILMIRVYLRQI